MTVAWLQAKGRRPALRLPVHAARHLLRVAPDVPGFRVF
jgi:hypothetical protein